MKKLIVCVLPLSMFAALAAADPEVGFEAQAYPSGIVGAVRAKVPVGERGYVTFRVGYNDADRDDNGEHDDETGGGPGLSAGYRWSWTDNGRGWFAGARVDLWRLEIDWVDAPGTIDEMSGTTDVLVLQPTAEAGYRFPFGRDRRWSFEPAVSFGAEINVDTDGEDVGEGAILLVGATVARRF